VSEWTCYEV